MNGGQGSLCTDAGGGPSPYVTPHFRPSSREETEVSSLVSFGSSLSSSLFSSLSSSLLSSFSSLLLSSSWLSSWISSSLPWQGSKPYYCEPSCVHYVKPNFRAMDGITFKIIKKWIFIIRVKIKAEISAYFYSNSTSKHIFCHHCPQHRDNTYFNDIYPHPNQQNSQYILLSDYLCLLLIYFCLHIAVTQLKDQPA